MTKELVESVKVHEGLRLKAYQDTVGVWTIGYGTNLQTLEIDEELAELWLKERLEAARAHAHTLEEYQGLDQARRDVIIEMIYNLGPKGYEGFVNTRRAIRERRFIAAASGMRASKWAQQVGNRADRLAYQMETGERWAS